MSGSDNQHETQGSAPSPHLAHHFGSMAQQHEAGKLGMWIFLATEILLFGGLFCAYAVYRSNHPEIFVYAHKYLDKTLGGINTAVLICSSLTMAWAVRCAQMGKRRGLIVLLVLTLACACGFLGIKVVEYEHKWKHGLLWGKRYQPHGIQGEPSPMGSMPATTRGATGSGPVSATNPAGPVTTQATSRKAVPGAPAGSPIVKTDERTTIGPAAEGPRGLATATYGEDMRRTRPPNVHIFFGVYFLMTGLHGLHVIAGMIAITWVLVRSYKGHFSGAYFGPVDLVGLYWHLVDMIWIYLFPLLYLIH